MYPISDTLKQLFLNGNKKCCKLTLNNATTVDCVITEADILSDSLTIDRYCSSGNKIEVGSAIAAELTLTLLNNNDKFNHITFEGSEVSLEIGIEGVSDSYIPCGKFTIDEPPRSSLHIKLRALDFMMLFDKKVDANDIQEIDTVENLLVKCCEVCNVEIWDKKALKNLPNIDQTVKVPTADITYRQIIQWIAQLTGTCAFMDWEGKLRLSWFKDSGVVLDPTNRYIGGTLDENNITIKGVCIKTQNTVVATEDSVNPVVIESNQLLYSDDKSYLEAIADNIATAIGTLTYRPFQCNTIPMPFLYPLDIVGYEGAAEGDFSTVITNHNFGLNKASALSAVGETATQSGYSSVKGLTKAEIDSAIREAMNGIDAKAEHIHIRYSAYENGFDASGNASMRDKPDATTEYLGTCADNNATAPDTPSSYKWVKIRGVDAYTVMLSNELCVFGELAQGQVTTIDVYVTAFKGETQIPTKVIKIGETEVSGATTDTVYLYDKGLVVKGFNNDGSSTSNYVTIVANYNLKEENGTVPLTIVAGGQTFKKDFSFSLVKNGADGGTLQVKYKSSSTKPTIYDNDVSGWDDAVPAPSAGQRVYMTQKLSTETNWSTPIQISAEDGTTPTITITSDGYWKINDDKTTVKAEGAPGKTPTITVGPNGNWFVDDKDTNTKAQGAQGKDGADIEYVYYRSQDAVTNLTAPTYSGGKLSDGWTASPKGITSTNKYEYVSVRTKPAGSTSWGEFSTPVIWSKWGEKGTDGDGVEYKYYLKNNATKPTYSATDTKWTDEPTGVSATNMYEYVVQITHHGDGNTTPSQVALWSKWGETGDDGRGVSKVVTEYYLSTSETTQTGGSWSEDAPEWVDEKYLWTRLATTYTDGTTEYSDPVVDASWKKTSVVDAASKELNETLANALGLHVTEYPVGTSKIRYYHSNPSLTDSKEGDTILVFNAKGFGVCTTGWNGGNPFFQNGAEFEKGKAVWNILAANKISADLIETGSIKSLSSAKVQTELNLNSGEATFEGTDVILGIKGVESESSGVTFPEGMWLQSKNADSQWAYTLSHGVIYFTKSYFIDLMRYQLGLIQTKPSDPYYSEIKEQLIKTRDIHCKNIYCLGSDGATEYELLNELTMMAEELNRVSTSLSSLQQKYLELEAELNKPHVHEEGSAITENYIDSTCAKSGSYDKVVYCKTCGEEINRVSYSIAKKDHSYTSSITKQPTCTATGTRKYTCSVCSNSYTETIAETGHKDTDGNGYCDVCNAKVGDFRTITVEVTPTNGGTVSGGGDYLYGSTATVTATANTANGYKFAGWYYGSSLYSSNTSYSFNVTSSRTLTAKFEKYYTVRIIKTPSNGGKVKLDGAEVSSGSYEYKEGSQITLLAEQADGYDFEKWVVNSGYATYTTNSLTQVVNANLTYEAVFKVKGGSSTCTHNYTVQVTKAATCTEEGIDTYTCTKCSHSYTQTMPALGHDYVYQEGYEATCTEEGRVGGAYCVRCRYGESMLVIPAKGHKDANSDGVCDNCGTVLTASGVTYKISSRNAGTGDTVGLYKWSDANAAIDMSSYLGTQTVLRNDSYSIGYYAKPGAGRKIEYVEQIVNGTTTIKMGENLFSSFLTNGVLNQMQGFYDDDYEGDTWEIVIYFTSDSSGGGTVLNDGDTITEGVETLVNVTQTQKRVFLKFVPNSTKTYTFESLNLADLDPDCQIYASDKTTMLNNKASPGAFSLSYNFNAGTTYWLAVIMYKGTGTLKVKIS